MRSHLLSWTVAVLTLGLGAAAFDRIPLKTACLSPGEPIYSVVADQLDPPIAEPSNRFPNLRVNATFQIVINSYGMVCEVVLARTNAASADAQSAGEEIRQWRFKPARRNGKPVAVRIAVNVNESRRNAPRRS